MKNYNFIDIQALKLFILLVLTVFNTSVFYGQETMEDAIVIISFSEENDSKTIIAKAIDQTGLPIEDLELYFFVKRTFSLLPIGDEFNSTDEEGIIEVEFPNDLPGDVNGNVIIVTKIIESDLYNDLALEKTKNWGIPIEIMSQKEEKRSLWATAANAPMSLIFTVSILILAVWYIICYILYKLYKISRIKPLNN
jgi:hypothetical protein